jgi:hypothetical protein
MAAFNNPNLAILELVAQALGPVCESVIFVGGCATGLLLTRERPDRIRITEDVDIVAQALTVHDYHGIEKQVRAQGFIDPAQINMNFPDFSLSKIDGKRKRTQTDIGATAREAQASRTVVQEDHRDHADC